ncbi:MhmaT1 transposase [Oopsacas minuta]|uniref:MhmaT1 transposase n=1 Tax=Oopsacas minuta TaxID=111878 RepID=A0AAV7JJ14_9METZ|nr:MhmaT1 transposase [Oopsacas minuta]
MEQERSKIIELFQAGKNPSEIFNLLKFPNSRRKFITRTIERYEVTGGITDKPRSGRPRSVTTQRLKKVVRQRIRRNPRRSMSKMAKELRVSRRSIGRVVKNDLHMRSFKRKRVHHITTLVKAKRASRSKGLLKRHAIHGLNSFLFSDEKLFTIEEATNPQNDRIISSSISSIPEELRYVSRIQKPLSVMVWAGISSIGRTPLIFVPAGVKIDTRTYRELILEPVIQDLSKTMFSGKPFVFQQDGAPAHTSNATQAWLRSNNPDFIQKEEWPPYSPDLNPMDYSIWSILETRACLKSHTNIDSLKKSLCREWERIPQEILRAAVEAFPKRLKAVIERKGGYIE